MRRMLDYQTYLAALQRWFHQAQVPNTDYKPEPVYHSLGARGGAHDGNGNRIDKNGRVIGRAEAYYGTINPINPITGRRRGEWLRPSGDDRMKRR
jgi:hypothetical protein